MPSDNLETQPTGALQEEPIIDPNRQFMLDRISSVTNGDIGPDDVRWALLPDPDLMEKAEEILGGKLNDEENLIYFHKDIHEDQHTVFGRIDVYQTSREDVFYIEFTPGEEIISQDRQEVEDVEEDEYKPLNGSIYRLGVNKISEFDDLIEKGTLTHSVLQSWIKETKRRSKSQ